ncbi:peptidoglycan-binding domain-containing protein [Streptomyces sp. NPDC041068]|uniref:peptidoglycan-binding domain-containing protein n=1 Tax=Streptomyces sp. NPDC041068 TaxID=3155130 RepID=UPI003410B579
MKRQLVLLGASAVLVGGSGLAAPAASAVSRADASAAAVHCDGAKYVAKGSNWHWLPKAGSGSLTCEMGRGANGKHVSALQQTLIRCYNLNTGGYDGDFGPSTESALRTAQSRAGTPADGIYGPHTRDALKWPVFNSSGGFTGSCVKH